MRVIDFRAGATHAKRALVLSLAQRERVEKVYTLVERDEVATWVKLGFAKEGNIPGFYKRSDAFMLGCSVSTNASPSLDSSVRLLAPVAVPRPLRDPTGRIRFDSEPPRIVDAEPEPVEEVVDTRAHDLAEKTLVRAKKAAKELAQKSLRGVGVAKVIPVQEAEVKKRLAAALKAGRALTAFEPFGRDVQRRYFVVTARGGFELVASIESQACFGNCFLELLTAPENDAERAATTAALKALCDRLLDEGVVTCFALAPSEDTALATAFVFNGFRRTGLLQNHMLVGTNRKDAIIFSRKLANPADE